MVTYHHGCGCGLTTNAAGAPRRKLNPLRLDPTRTTLLRRSFVADMAKRFAALRGEITQLIAGDDAFGISAANRAATGQGSLAAVLAQNADSGAAFAPVGLVQNTRWRFETDAGKIAGFQAWLKERVDAGILEVSPGNVETPWLEPYIKSAYKAGAVRAYTDTHAARIAAASAVDLPFLDGGKEEFLRTAFNTPTATAKVQQLSTRAFSQLKGVTAQMDQEMTRVLSDGLTAGKGARELAREMTKVVDGMEKRRALTVARTELIHTHSEGQLDSYELLGVEELGVMAEWSTAHDDLVCPQCQPLEGVILTPKEARGMIPRHPNCRCTWIPAGVGEHDGGTTTTQHAGPGQGLSPPGTAPTGKTTGQTWSWDSAGQRIRDSVKAEHPKLSAADARKASRWVGADVLTVAGKLKPGGKAWQAAKAAKKASKGAQLAQDTLAAKAAARARAAANSEAAKVTLVMEKYGLTPLDVNTFGDDTSLGIYGFSQYIKKAGLEEDLSDWTDLKGRTAEILAANPNKLKLQAQMEAADGLIAAKVAKEAKAVAAAEAAAAAQKAANDAFVAAQMKVAGAIADAKTKYGLTDDYLEMSVGGKLAFAPGAATRFAKAKYGVDFDEADLNALFDDALDAIDGGKPILVAQVEALDKIAKAKAATDPAALAKAFAAKQKAALEAPAPLPAPPPVTPVAAAEKKAIADLTDYATAAGTTTERRIAIDGTTGEVFFDLTGDAGSAHITDDAFSQKWLNGSNIIDLHNHPDHTSFSDGDWGTFAFSNVGKMVVVTKGGHVYSISKGAGYTYHTPAQMKKMWNDFSDEIEDWSPTLQEITEEINKKMAKATGAVFESIPPAALPAPVPVAPAPAPVAAVTPAQALKVLGDLPDEEISAYANVAALGKASDKTNNELVSLWGSKGTVSVEVDINELRYSQPGVQRKKVRGIIEEGWDDSKGGGIVVVRLEDGTLNIVDGHHRWAAARLLGRGTAKVDLVDLAKGKPLPGAVPAPAPLPVAPAPAPNLAHSLKVKTGMLKKKYGLADDEIYTGGTTAQLDKKAIAKVAEKQGIYLTPAEVKQVRYAVPTDVNAPLLAAQMEQLEAIGKAHAKIKMTPGQAAIHKTKSEDGVLAWKQNGTGVSADDIDVLDHADYSGLSGWGAPKPGQTQSYGVVLFDDEGRVLLREPAGHYGGAHWTFAKGGGTKPGTTALAELAEETGHKGLIHDALPDAFEGSTTKTNYFLGTSKGFDANLMDAETAQTKWFTFDEAKEAISSSTDPTVVARDLKVLEAAFAQLHSAGATGGNLPALQAAGAQAVAAAKQAAQAAAHGHKVKLGMAQKNFAKAKFGGGVTDADWVSASKTKLNADGVNKVLSEKGWHTTTLPAGTAQKLREADDVVAQKAILDGLKKAPKGTPPPVLPAKAADPLAHANVTAEDFAPANSAAGDPPLVKALAKGLQPGQDKHFVASEFEEWAEGKPKATAEDLAALANKFKAENPDYYTTPKALPAKAADAVPGGAVVEADLVNTDIYVPYEDKLKALGKGATQPAYVVTDLYDGWAVQHGWDEVIDGEDFVEAANKFKIAHPHLYGAPPANNLPPINLDLDLPDAAPAVPKKAVANLPLPSMAELKKIKNLPGSTKPWLAKDAAGKQWVVKDVGGSGIKPEHLKSEATADELYRRLGIRTNRGGIVTTPEGPSKVTEFLEGGQTLAEWKAGKTGAEVQAMYNQIKEGFVADALLANYDVAGLSMDNIFVVADKAYRIDNGGALTFRAQGGKKVAWGKKVEELKTLLDPSINSQTATIFKGITDAEIHKQIRHVVAQKEALLQAVDDAAVRAVLGQRIDDLEALLPAVPRSARVQAPQGARRAAYGTTPEAAARAKQARSNGVNIAGDAGDIEDNNILVWGEVDSTGKEVTRLQLKVTPTGSRKIEDALGEEMKKAKAAAPTSPTGPQLHPEDMYWPTVQEAAKTIGAHAADGAYNTGKITAVEQIKAQIQQGIQHATGDKKKMLQHYEKTIDALLAHKAAGTAPAMGSAKAYTYTPAAAKAAPVPAPTGYRVKRDTGINFRTNTFKDGNATGNGGVNRFSSDEAYTIETDDGITMSFLPNDGRYHNTSGRALHGTVALTVPEGVGEEAIKKATRIIDSLGIDTSPPSAAYEEAVYLHRGVYINNKHTDASYKAIWENPALTPEEKVPKLKAWVKANMGIDPDAAKYYDPAGVTKHADGTGHRYWNRWDITVEDLKKEMGDYVVQHTTGSLSDSPSGRSALLVDRILQSGGEFTSTTGRIRKGVDVSATGGASYESDINSGGASYFFTRITENPRNGFFFKPRVLLRQDAISYGGDNYGSIGNLGNRKASISGMKGNAANNSNETVFKEGFSLDDLEFIKVRPEEVQGVLDAFKKHGVTTLPDGRAVKDIVVTSKPTTRVFE